MLLPSFMLLRYIFCKLGFEWRRCNFAASTLKSIIIMNFPSLKPALWLGTYIYFRFLQTDNFHEVNQKSVLLISSIIYFYQMASRSITPFSCTIPGIFIIFLVARWCNFAASTLKSIIIMNFPSLKPALWLGTYIYFRFLQTDNFHEVNQKSVLLISSIIYFYQMASRSFTPFSCTIPGIFIIFLVARYFIKKPPSRTGQWT